MEYSSAIAPATLPSTPPKFGRRAQPFLNWDLASTNSAGYYGLEVDALSSGVNSFGYPEQTQPYKRRRLDVETPCAYTPAHAVSRAPYETFKVSPFPVMVDQSNDPLGQGSAATDGTMLTTEFRTSASISWLYMDRFCCPSCLPNWLLYEPLPQDAEPTDKFEPYYDNAAASASLVSQQYVSPEFTETLGIRCHNLGVLENLSMQQCASSAAATQPVPLSMAIHDQPPIKSFDIQSSTQLVQATYNDHDASSILHTTLPPASRPIVYVNQEERSSAYPASAEAAVSVLPHKLPLRLSPPPNDCNVVVKAPKKSGPCGSKRGPFKDQSLRQQTACTRAHGACIECARQRVRCIPNPDDPLGECLVCAKMRLSRPSRGPCIRKRITDVRLSKPGQVEGFEWTRRWNHARKDIKIWASDESKTICISEGYSNNSMLFEVRQFVPQKGDKLERSWVHQGSRRSVPVPPFALIKLESAKDAYRKHMVATESGAVDKEVGLSYSLLRRTYDFASKLRRDQRLGVNERQLLDTTFQLWMVIRFSSKSTWIVGKETLGMSRDILETSPDPGKIPLPPVLGAQLDSVLIHDILQDFRRRLLRQLDRAFRRYQHQNWLVIYLVSFILLHNAALITAHDAKYAQKHGMGRRFAREAHVAEYHMSATVILAHFHNCTRNHPFSDQCNETDLQTLAQMTDEQIHFIRETRAYMKMHEQEWARIRDEGLYEHDSYFVSQMYQDPWTPQAFSAHAK